MKIDKQLNKIKELIRNHFDQSPIKNRILEGRKIKDYSDLSRFLALKYLEESLSRFLIDKHSESRQKEFLLARKAIESIESIELCGQCGRVVTAKIGGIGWWKEGTFQTGEINKRIASWCSRECYKRYRRWKKTKGHTSALL